MGMFSIFGILHKCAKMHEFKRWGQLKFGPDPSKNQTELMFKILIERIMPIIIMHKRLYSTIIKVAFFYDI